MLVVKYISDIQYFPMEGIMFKGITPIVINAEAGKKYLDMLIAAVSNQATDKVLGVEFHNVIDVS